MHLVDSTLFWTASSGGVRTYLEAKEAWLAARPGVRYSLVIPGPQAARTGNRYRVTALRLPFGNGYRFPLRKGPWREQLMALAPDIIEAGDPYRPAWAALEAGQRLQVPVVGFYHSDLPRLVGSRTGHWSNRWMDAYVCRLYRHFDRVLVPSVVMAERLRGLGLERVFVQPLGVDPVQFHPCRRNPEFRRELGLADATRLLIFAGRGSREKNLPVLLKAMTRLGNGYHLHLVGSHMPRRLPANVSSNAGFVDRDEVARRLASSDALLHAGDRETFGLVVLEAMSSGLPVVGVRAGAVAELVVPGTGLLAEPHSADSLANTVRALFADGWQGMGHFARCHVEQHYTWDRVLPLLLQHYRALTGLDQALPASRRVVSQGD